MADCRPTAHERFWSKVDRNGPIPPHRPELGPCWVWTGARSKGGYGQIRVLGKLIYAHRFGYEIQCGPLLPTESALHHCDNPPCVRGEHLFKGDTKANMQDMAAKSRAGATRHPELTQRGEDSPRARLSTVQVIEIRRRATAGETCRAISADYPVSLCTIQRIVAGRAWGHLPPEHDLVCARYTALATVPAPSAADGCAAGPAVCGFNDYLGARRPGETSDMAHEGYHAAVKVAEQHAQGCKKWDSEKVCSICLDNEIRLRV